VIKFTREEVILKTKKDDEVRVSEMKSPPGALVCITRRGSSSFLLSKRKSARKNSLIANLFQIFISSWARSLSVRMNLAEFNVRVRHIWINEDYHLFEKGIRSRKGQFLIYISYVNRRMNSLLNSYLISAPNCAKKGDV
jgi:hypothetical protein